MQQIVPALKPVEESALSPRSDDLDGGLDRVEGKLKAYLIVALTRTELQSVMDFGLGD